MITRLLLLLIGAIERRAWAVFGLTPPEDDDRPLPTASMLHRH